MEEGHVTVDGHTYDVHSPFIVIATQNPIEQAGTYALPEAQLDRFLMRTSLGHPDSASTEALLASSQVRDRAAGLTPVATGAEIIRMKGLADLVHVDPALIRYVRELAEATRTAEEVRLGLSTRGCLAWIRAAKVWALGSGRGHVTPEDVTTLAEPVIGHRLILHPDAMFDDVRPEDVVQRVLGRVGAPRDRG